MSIHVRVVDDGRPQFDEEGRGKREKGKRVGGKENERRYERNEGTYSRRVVVIGGNFIILRHYPRYCNAIKLDTLRTPRGSKPSVYLGLLPLASLSSSAFRFLREDAGTRLALLRTSSPCPNNFTWYIYLVRFS